MTPKNVAVTVEQFAFKAVWFVAGASLGVNSYLVKERVTEIGETLKHLTATIQIQEVHNAVNDQKVADLEIQSAAESGRLDRTIERVQALEVACSKSKPR